MILCSTCYYTTSHPQFTSKIKKLRLNLFKNNVTNVWQSILT